MKRYIIALGICLLAAPTMAADDEKPDALGATARGWVLRENAQPNYDKVRELAHKLHLINANELTNTKAVELCKNNWRHLVVNQSVEEPEQDNYQGNERGYKKDLAFYKDYKNRKESLETALYLAGYTKGDLYN